jgi:hypothetical protein
MDIQNPKKLARNMRQFYGKEWLNWAPEILEKSLRDKFNQDLTEEDISRIEAIREVIRSDRFFFEPLLFEKCIRAFNNLPHSFDVWEGVGVEELAYGLYVAEKIAGENKVNKESVGEQVRAYIGTTLAQAPIIYPEPSFHFDVGEKELYKLIGYSVDDSLPNRVRRKWRDIDKNTFDQLVRTIRSRHERPREDKSDDAILYRNLMRLALVWGYLSERDATPNT